MLVRLIAWIESLSDTIRPATYGALLIVMFMLMRGAWLVAPLAIIYVFATSSTPLRDIGRATSVVVMAMGAGALSGLAYGVLGRHLRTAFPGGRYAAGIVTVAPYMFLLTAITRLADGKPMRQPLTPVDLWIPAGMSLLFGVVVGNWWFTAEPTARANKRGPT